jgi:hypothetical protein
MHGDVVQFGENAVTIDRSSLMFGMRQSQWLAKQVVAPSPLVSSFSVARKLVYSPNPEVALAQSNAPGTVYRRTTAFSLFQRCALRQPSA